MFKRYKIAYICEHVVFPKITCMLPRKYWGMFTKQFTFETFFDFSDFWLLVDFCWFFIDFSDLNIDFLVIFYTSIHYELTLFFRFSGTIWWTRSEQKVNEKWTKSQPKANFLWTKVTEKVNLDKNDFSPFLHLKSIEIDFSG